MSILQTSNTHYNSAGTIRIGNDGGELSLISTGNVAIKSDAMLSTAFVLTAANGAMYRYTANNDGTLITTKIN